MKRKHLISEVARFLMLLISGAMITHLFNNSDWGYLIAQGVGVVAIVTYLQINKSAE